jgi:hypothetical protein
MEPNMSEISRAVLFAVAAEDRTGYFIAADKYPDVPCIFDPEILADPIA